MYQEGTPMNYCLITLGMGLKHGVVGTPSAPKGRPDIDVLHCSRWLRFDISRLHLGE